MICPVCKSRKCHRVGSRKCANGDYVKRKECTVCSHRWNERNGILEYSFNSWIDVDWRVPASENCANCVHQINGFCSLGFPEASDPAFVTECEARQVQEHFDVVQ